MSHQNLADAFAPAEAAYRSKIMQETWGHLAPKRNRTYYGSITFAIGIFGDDELNPTPLSCNFSTQGGEELDSSPWFYDHMADFLSNYACEDRENRAGKIFKFEGTFRNYEFKGTIRQMKLEG
jgi:hypothetical protein